MNVFLYGTLRDDVLRKHLLGQHTVTPATLTDHIVLSQDEAPLPAIQFSEGDATDGILLRNCSERQKALLDSYELPFDYFPSEVTVKTDAGPETAVVYKPGPTVAISAIPWSLADWDAHSGPLHREMAREVGSNDPVLSGDELKRQWHMVALRAGVRLRAQADQTPATLRYDAGPEDVTVPRRDPLVGGFFKFAAFGVTHRTFQNTTVGPLDREIIVACDAAIVLPYDPKTDRVLLVEQIRMGPLIRGVPNPWLLEPVAGMIDGHETPEDAALRETREEAELEDVTLEKMFSFYPSPGSTTDYFNCYAAIADLPEPTSYTGGLAEENEDLRIHVLARENALDLIETGEANVGPLIAMLYWVTRQKDRLQSAA